MGYIITANLAKGRKVITEPVFRWNHGMVLKFIGVTLPDNYRVDFSNTLNGTAKSQMGTAENGVIIPDEYFMPGQTIFAWVVLSPTENSAITEFQVSIPIDPKAKATDEEPSSQQESIIDQAISAMNTTISNANEAVSHYPKIVDEYWYVWDVTESEYVTTGVKSTGEDGVSPVVNVESITGGHRVTITDANGDHVFDVLDGVNGDPGRGIATIAKTGTSGLTDTYTITYTDGNVQTYTVVNGADGVSPTIVVSSITGGHRLTITDAQGTQTVDVLDGTDGDDGRGIVSIEKTGTAGLVDTYTITYTDNTTATFTVTNGADGSPGASAYVWIRYAAAEPSQDSDMKTTPDAWMGIYSGDSATAPTAYTAYTWYNIKGQTGPVQDVQVNGVSVLQDGVANVPVASSSKPGAVRVDANYGIRLGAGATAGVLLTNMPDESIIKAYNNPTGITAAKRSYQPITSSRLKAGVFYGLSEASGDTTQSQSSNAVGSYTESAKSAISTMLNSPVSVTGTTPTINALSGVRYVCGEVSTITITVPASGIIDVVFTSGSTPAVLTINGTVRWANGFDPDNLDADTVYELNIADGLGVAGIWT